MARKRVIMLPSPAQVTSGSWSALKRKRKTLWHNAERNLLVARVAVMCLHQDRQALKDMRIPARRNKHQVGGNRVVVLVENMEHALVLGPLLPGWEMLDTLATDEPMDDEDEDEEPGSLLTQGSVMTWMYAERYGVRANYLVRATGWRGRLGLDSGNWLPNFSARITVIDFDDAWDAQAMMATESRVQEYKNQRLEVLYADEMFAET